MDGVQSRGNPHNVTADDQVSPRFAFGWLPCLPEEGAEDGRSSRTEINASLFIWGSFVATGTFTYGQPATVETSPTTRSRSLGKLAFRAVLGSSVRRASTPDLPSVKGGRWDHPRLTECPQDNSSNG
jgi:hypothetical protein